jgi:hypothetical protein
MLFRRLPEIQPVTLNKPSTRPLTLWFQGNRPATPLGCFELPGAQV